MTTQDRRTGLNRRTRERRMDEHNERRQAFQDRRSLTEDLGELERRRMSERRADDQRRSLQERRSAERRSQE